MPNIHPTAIIHKGAEIGSGTEIGPYSIVGSQVKIGKNCRVMNGVVLDGWTEIGDENTLWTGAVIGVAPQDLSYEEGMRSFTKIGNRNTIREYVTVHRASEEDGITSIGDDNLLMAQTHVAHNCLIANQVIIANAVGMAGHVVVEDQAVIGGMTGIHQFIRVGRLAMLGGMSKVRQDIPPFCMVDGSPVRLAGLNSRGLQRRGLSQEARSALKAAYSIITRRSLNLGDAIKVIEQEVESYPEVMHLCSFLKSPSRLGVCIRERDRMRRRS